MLPNRGKNRRASRGFTLVEVLITVVVLSTGLVLVLQGLHGVLHVWGGAVARIRSVMTAQEAFAGFQLVTRQGIAPDRTGLPFGVESVAGREGLYRVQYLPNENMPESADDGYTMYFFIAPPREEQP